MEKPVASKRRPQTLGEEIANSVSAGVGLLAVIAGIPLLVSSAIQRRNGFTLAGAIVFAAAMVSLHLASTIYHALPKGGIKQFFRMLDHAAIYVLIAGTYTPFALGAVRGVWGWTLFGVVWSLAMLGIFFTRFGGLKYRRLSTLTTSVSAGWHCPLFAFFGSTSNLRDCSGYLQEVWHTPPESFSTRRSGFRTATWSGICL